MSTDGTSPVSVDPMAQAEQTRKASWLDDLRSVRIVRFGLGVAAAMAIAFGFDWPLQFLLPVLTASLLDPPHSPVSRDRCLDSSKYAGEQHRSRETGE